MYRTQKEVVNNFEMVEIKQENAEIEFKPEFLHETVEEAWKDYHYVEIKQEQDVNVEYMEEVNQEVKIEYKEIKKEVNIEYKEVKDELVIENVCEAPTDKNYKEDDDADQDETSSEESDNPGLRKMSNKNLSKIKPKPTYYECKKCFEQFTEFKSLKKHREEFKHLPKTSSCTICNKIIGRYKLKRHMKTHTVKKEKPYCCEICEESFSYSSQLHRHKLSLHSGSNNQMYHCQSCEKSYKNLKTLKIHQKIHTEGDIFVVNKLICGNYSEIKINNYSRKTNSKQRFSMYGMRSSIRNEIFVETTFHNPRRKEILL